MRGILVILYCFSALVCVKAQTSNTLLGGRSSGMANVGVVLADEWAIFNNIAGLTQQKQLAVLAAYENRFNFAPFQTFGVGAVIPILENKSAGGFTISRFGDALYNELKISAGAAYQLDMVSIGLKINYLQVALEDLGSRASVAFELGGLVALTEQISFGAHIYNFNRARFRSEFAEDELVPVVVKAGLSYAPTEVVLLSLEVEKDIDFPASFKAGIEYQIIKGIFGRTGVRTAPFDLHFGGGIRQKKWIFDAALSTQGALGLSYGLSLAYLIGQEKSQRNK